MTQQAMAEDEEVQQPAEAKSLFGWLWGLVFADKRKAASDHIPE